MAKAKQVGDWLSALAGQTGVNSLWLRRAAEAGVIRPGMSPDEVYRAVSNMVSPPPVRQMPLPMGDSADEIRALIPYGHSGPGVPTSMSAPGVPVEVAGELIEAPLRGLPAPVRQGLPAPQQRRLTYSGAAAAQPQRPTPRPMDDPNSPDYIPDVNHMGIPEGSITDWSVGVDGRRGPDYTPEDTGMAPGSQLWRDMRDSALVHDNMARNRDGHMNNTLPLAQGAASPDMSLGSPLWDQMNRSTRAYDNIRTGRTANLRNQTPDFVRIAQDNIQEANRAAQASRAAEARNGSMARNAAVAGGVAAGAGTGAYLMKDGKPKPSTTADLAEESRPAPKVAATDKDGVPLDEGKFTEMFKRQYLAREEKRKTRGEGPYAPKPAPAAAPAASPSAQAKAILADLNERRRKAGGEVPEAKQMMDQANRLLAQGNQQRNTPGYKPAPMSNPREQAQALLQKLNADRMAAGGEVPHSQKVLAEVRRLQAMADEQDWRR